MSMQVSSCRGRRLKVLMSAYCCDKNEVSEDRRGFEWVRALSKHCDLHVFVMPVRGRDCGTERLRGVHTHPIARPQFAQRHPALEKTIAPSYFYFTAVSFFQAKRLLLRNRFDLVHQVTPMAARFPSSMALLKLPFILGPLGGGVSIPPAFCDDVDDEPMYLKLRSLDGMRLRLDPTMLMTLNRADRLLLAAPYVLDYIPRSYRRKCAFMLEPGIEEPSSMPMRPLTSDLLRLLYVGQVEAVKGLRYLVQALSVLDRDIDWCLTVVGDGCDMHYVKRLAGEMGLLSRITFTGWLRRSDVDRYYSQADVFCFPSIKEATGNVLLEAMSHALPLLVSDNGGPASIVNDECGIKVSVESPKRMISDLIGALRLLASSPDLRARMGAAGRARVREEYCWPRKARRMVRIYEEVVAEARYRRRSRMKRSSR